MLIQEFWCSTTCCSIEFSVLLQLMDLLFSFLEPNRPHSALLSGYFSKVWIDCLYACLSSTVECRLAFIVVQLNCLMLFLGYAGCCVLNGSEDYSTDKLCEGVLSMPLHSHTMNHLKSI